MNLKRINEHAKVWLAGIAALLALIILFFLFISANVLAFFAKKTWHFLKICARKVWSCVKAMIRFYFKKKKIIDRYTDTILGLAAIVLGSSAWIANIISTMPHKGYVKGLLVIGLFFLMFTAWGLGSGIYIALTIWIRNQKKDWLDWAKTYCLVLILGFVVAASPFLRTLDVFGTVGDKISVPTYIKPEISYIQIASGEALKHDVWARYRNNQRHYETTLAQLPKVEKEIKWATKKIFWNSKNIILPIMVGKGIKESSLNPQSISKDGGKGLYMITGSHPIVFEEAEKILHHKPNLFKARDNALVACLMLRNNLWAFKGNLGIAILAFNIGPNNQGLRFVIEKYVGKPIDKVHITEVAPYLQEINKKFHVGPKTYVEEVLAGAAAYKCYKTYGMVLPYQKNFKKIQALGIPGVS